MVGSAKRTVMHIYNTHCNKQSVNKRDDVNNVVLCYWIKKVNNTKFIIIIYRIIYFNFTIKVFLNFIIII